MLHPDYKFDLNHSSENEDEFLRTYATRFSNLNGYGRLQTPSGTYVGTFEVGIVVGDAKFHRKDGVLFEGIWKRNKDGTTSSISEGKMSSLDGNWIYHGGFGRHFVPHGQGTLLYRLKNSQGQLVQKKYSGVWQSDKP